MLETVLLIDDDETDHFFFNRLVKNTELIKQAICFQYADEALEYLKQTDRPKINAIFLDINMPRMNGFEFLEEAERLLPESFGEKAVVVMLTSSIAPQDKERANGFSAIKAYVNKPLDAKGLADIIANIS